MAIRNSRNERVYAQVTHPFVPDIPNSGGAASVANGDYVPHISLAMPREDRVLDSRAKTGALGRLAGFSGRRGGTWNAEFPLRGSNAAGTPPDLDPIWEAIFGQAGVDTASTSVAYSLADAVPQLALWSFLNPTDAQTPHRVAWGAVVDEFEVASGEEEAVLRCGGPFVYLIDGPNFANFETAAKGGLTTFPTEPAAPSSVGGAQQAFLGAVTLNGVGSFPVESWSIRGRLNRGLRAPYNSFYATIPQAGIREILASVRLFLDPSANLNTFRDLARSKTPFDASLAIGNVTYNGAGNVHTFALNNVVLTGETMDDANPEWVIGWADNPASMTNATTRDELALTIT